MNISIKLNISDGPAMWFLGEPKKSKIGLNWKSPGPAQIAFESLSEYEQKHILQSMQRNHIEVDVDFDTLYAAYLNQYVPQKVEAKRVEEELLAQRPEVVIQKEKLKQEKFNQDDQMKLKCERVIKTSGRQIKKFVEKIDDVRWLRYLRELETTRTKGPRGVVLDSIADKINKWQIEKIKIVEAEEISNNSPYDKIKFEIEESDKELINFARGEIYE